MNRREIFRQLFREDEIRKLAVAALNEIDDYFEYRCESMTDQAEVHRILEKFAFGCKALTPDE